MTPNEELQQTMEKLNRLVQRDSRYKAEAYLFVRDAFLYAVEKLNKEQGLTGTDLLQGIKDLGLERYGPTARLVFEHWGVETTQDFGRVVMNMVQVGLMHKAAEDTLEDFKDVFDFQEEFENKFEFRIDKDIL